jgi:hypothetical protein
LKREFLRNIAADTGARANDEADRFGHYGFRLL